MFITFHVSPIKGLDSIFDDCGYILCSMDNPAIRVSNELRLNFMDVGEDHPYAFKIEDAEAIIACSDDLIKKGITEFYVCCDAGESRSPAIAAALMESYGCDAESIWNDHSYRPNMHVYKVMKDALKKQII